MTKTLRFNDDETTMSNFVPHRLWQSLLVAITLLVPIASASDGRMIGGAVSGGLSMGLPLGLPPAEQNGRILAVAPEDAAVFVHWSRVQAPDAASKNRTENLMANREVREFFDYVESNIKRAIAKATENDPGSAIVANAASQLVETLLTHETAGYVRFNGEPSGGVICDLGDAAPQIKNLVEGMTKMVGDDVTVADVDGLTVYSIEKAPVPKLELTVGKRYLILGVGDNEFTSIVSRFKANQVTPWLAAARGHAKVKRIANLCYVNLDRFDSFMKQTRMVPEEFAALGADGFKSMTCVTGLDDDAVVIRTWFDTDDATKQRLRSISGKLTERDISDISLDATVMAAFKLNFEAIANEVLASLDKIEPGTSEEFLREFKQEFGFDFKNDIIAAIGDSVQIYESPREGGRLFTGWVAVASIRDEAKLKVAESWLAKVMDDPYAPARIKSRKFAGETVSYLVFNDESPGFTPAWCISKGRLIVASYPQSIYGLLQRPPMPPAKKLLSTLNEQDASIFIKLREDTLAKTIYPFLYMVASFLPLEVDEDLEGIIDIDPGMLPSLPAISDHLASATVTCDFSDGLEIVRHQTLPPAGIAIVAGIAAFGSQVEREFNDRFDEKVAPPPGEDAAEFAPEMKEVDVASKPKAMKTPDFTNFEPPLIKPDSAIAAVMALEKAQKLADQGRHHEAIIELALLTTRHPKDIAAHYALGNSFYETKQYEKARESFEKCIEIAPDDFRGYLGRGKTKWIKDLNEESVADFTKATDLNSESADSWLFLGLANRSLKRTQESIVYLTKSVSINPEQWYALYTLGNSHFDAGNYQKAIDSYGRSIEQRKTNTSAYYWRAQAYENLEQYDKAIEDMNVHLQQRPLDANALESRGDLFRDASKNRLAIRDYNALIGLDKNNADAWKGRGSAWMNLEQYDNAIKDYTRGLEIKPDQWTFANRAICWDEKDDTANVIADYSRAIELNPKYEFALKWRASAYMNSGEFAKAKSDFDNAIEAGSDDDSSTLGNYSWMLAACPDENVRNGEMAVNLATKAAELTQWKEAWIIDNVAAGHAEMGDFAKAIQFAEKAIAASDSDSIRADIQGRLDLYKQNKKANWE